MNTHHTDALDEEGNDLLAMFVPSADPPEVGTWHPDLFAESTILPDAIDGVLRISTFDGRSMMEVRFQIADMTAVFSLNGEGCTRLVKLSQRICGVPEFAGKVTADSVRSHVEEWLVSCLWPNQAQRKTLVESVFAALRVSIGTHEVWVPLFDVELQHDLHVGPYFVKSITSSDIAEIHRSLRNHLIRNGRDPLSADAYAQDIARHTMGRAAIVLTTEGDLARAQERAYDVADNCRAPAMSAANK
jgi:hypothetical protein